MSEADESRDDRDDAPRRDRSDRGDRPDRGDRSRGTGGADRPRRAGRADRDDSWSRERPARGDRSSGAERPARGGRSTRAERPARGDRPFGDEASERGDRSGRRAPSRGAAPSRDPRPFRGAASPRGARPVRDARPERDARPSRDARPERDAGPGSRHDDPPIPEDVAASDLDRGARAELKSLSKENADRVARHLVMAGRLIDDDPDAAHRHAQAAARTAGRIGVARETLGITAYAVGDYALALRELRTFRRLTGREDQLPLMVDSERGLGRPDKALELGRSVPRVSLDPAVQASLAIAMSGARLDQGQPELALQELRIPQLDPDRAFAYSPALFDAYATVLEDLGRTDEAAQWRERAERAESALESASAPAETIDVIELVVDEDATPVPASEPDDAPNS